MYGWCVLSVCFLYADFVHPFCLHRHLSYIERRELQLRFCYFKAYENEYYKHCNQMRAIARLTLGIKVTDLKRIINWLKSGTWEMCDFVAIDTATLGAANALLLQKDSLDSESALFDIKRMKGDSNLYYLFNGLYFPILFFNTNYF